MEIILNKKCLTDNNEEMCDGEVPGNHKIRHLVKKLQFISPYLNLNNHL